MICFRHWYFGPARQAWAAWAAEVCGSRWAESMSGVVPPIAIIMDTSHDEREREGGRRRGATTVQYKFQATPILNHLTNNPFCPG